MGRGLTLGLGVGVGLLVGWLLFGREAAPVRESPDRSVAPSPRPPASDSMAASAKPVATEEAPTRKPFTTETPTGLTINRNDDGSLRYLYAGQVIQPRPLAAIDASARRAREQKNWPEFFACILEYAVHDSPEADRRLVAIMADDTLHLQGPWIGDRFREALEDSEIDGIAAAARARASMELEDKPGSRWAGRGFFALVAQYGDEESVAWLDGLAAGHKKRREIERALALGAGNPIAAERICQRQLNSPANGFAYWREFAKSNPDAAQDCASRLVRSGYGNDNSFQMLGAATTESTLGKTHAVLGELETDRLRLGALRAVEQIRRNGLDTADFRALIDLPHRILQRTGESAAEQKLASKAIASIRNHEVAWTQANLDALRAVAQGPWKDLAKRALAALERIEREQMRQSGWEPERAG